MRPLVARFRFDQLALAFVLSVVVALACDRPIGAEQRIPWTLSRVEGAPEEPLPFQAVEAFGGKEFETPTCLVPLPGTDRFFVGEISGRIYSFRKSLPNEPASLALDLGQSQATGERRSARGEVHGAIYDLAFHPQVQKNRQLFITYSVTGEKALVRVSRFELDTTDPARIRPGSEVEVLTWDTQGHSGGCLRFGPDGYLYITTGDGSNPQPPDLLDAGQDISNLLASVLRIDVDRTDGDRHYLIPEDNPFVDRPGARPEVWAFGLRNAWKMDFDQQTGHLWLADVGWETWEMIHRIVRGGNYGWPIVEGPMPLRTEVPVGPTPILPPILSLSRSESHSVTGGIVYRGDKFPELAGSFLYGCYRMGTIWSLPVTDGRYDGVRKLAQTPLRIVAFAQDADGEIYVMDHDFTGKIYQLTRTPKTYDPAKFPRRLSETGLFNSVRDLEPAPGVVPYELNAEPWMDGAVAHRLIALPNHQQIMGNSAEQSTPWQFPEGTVLVRTLMLHSPGMDPMHIETQLLHREAGSWRAYSYWWNTAQDDAQLVPASGAKKTFVAPSASDGQGTDAPSGQKQQTWRILRRNECFTCHSAAMGTVLGFQPEQLDRPVSQGGADIDQLKRLKYLGLFDASADLSPSSAGRLTDPYDAHADLNERARSYLHVNCSMCHNPRGEPWVMIHTQKHLTLQESKILAEPTLGSFGISGARIASPRDPFGSVLLYRIAKLGIGRMPHTGSQVVDSRAVKLLHDWIISLDPPETLPPVVSPPTTVQALAALFQEGITVEEQDRAIQQLLETTHGALALATHLHRGTLSSSQQDRIVQLSQSVPSANRQTLFETFVPESQRRQRLGPDIVPEDILKHVGDSERGKQIYHSDAARCRTCHEPDLDGHTLGADLKQLSKNYSRAEILHHILEPSDKIAPEHTPYLLVTSAGLTHAGLLVEKSAEEIVLLTAQKQLLRVPSDEVELLEKQRISMMPERLLSDMTAQEAADLLAYLQSLR